MEFGFAACGVIVCAAVETSAGAFACWRERGASGRVSEEEPDWCLAELGPALVFVFVFVSVLVSVQMLMLMSFVPEDLQLAQELQQRGQEQNPEQNWEQKREQAGTRWWSVVRLRARSHRRTDHRPCDR